LRCDEVVGALGEAAYGVLTVGRIPGDELSLVVADL